MTGEAVLELRHRIRGRGRVKTDRADHGTRAQGKKRRPDGDEPGQRFLVVAGMPNARLNKSKVSCDKEDGFYRNWIGGVLGDKPLVEIAPFDLERLKKVMCVQ